MFVHASNIPERILRHSNDRPAIGLFHGVCNLSSFFENPLAVQ